MKKKFFEFWIEPMKRFCRPKVIKYIIPFNKIIYFFPTTVA